MGCVPSSIKVVLEPPNTSFSRSSIRSPSPSANRSGHNTHSRSIHNIYETTMFSGSNLTVSGGSYIINTSPDAGLILLSQAASKEAMHDSSERSPPPKCHPGTRTKVVEAFLAWIKTQNPGILVYWLHAPFGHGKSAVMQTIMDSLVEEDCHLFAGSFFFGRGRPGRDKMIYLFATIAYQIAMFIPGMREHINSAMLADPTLPSKSLEIQLQSLIIDPLFKCPDGPHFHHSPTVFIDGLDECDSIDSQVAALELIAAAVHRHRVPLRFVIASRPEAHIRDCFDRSPLSGISEQKELPDDDGEMTVYVRTRFDEIYTARSRTMQQAGVQKPWPSPEVIGDLVKRACGQYVFVDTVLRFVGAHRLNPQSQLQIVLTHLSDASVFTDMDSIYRLILEQCPDIYRYILTIVIDNLIEYNEDCPNAVALADFWQLPPADVSLVVEALAAVVEEDSESLCVHHLSFQEFLEDESRSGIFFCDQDLAEQRIRAREATVFRLVMTGDLVLQNSSLLDWCEWIFANSTSLMKESTPSELLELVRRGMSNTASDRKALQQWYYMVDGVMQNILDYSGLFPTKESEKWDEGDGIDMKVVVELYNCCLGIWKGIADRAFAQMDSRLANVIFGMDSGHRFTVADVASAAGMDKEVCLHSLNQQPVLFYHDLVDELSIDSTLYFRDRRYYRLDKDGTCQRIQDVRKEFYSNIG